MQTNIDIIRELFSQYMFLGHYDDEEQMLIYINDYDEKHSDEIDWYNISSNPKLPEFIMEEFADMLDWYSIIFVRRMTQKTINKFENHIKSTLDKQFNLLSESELEGVVSDINDNIHVLFIIKKFQSCVIKSILKIAFKNNYTNIVERIEFHPRFYNKISIGATLRELRDPSNISDNINEDLNNNLVNYESNN